jgi:hypothetical protein
MEDKIPDVCVFVLLALAENYCSTENMSIIEIPLT